MSGLASDDITPWLPPEDLDRVRRQVPMLYVDVLPVRVDATGQVQQVGLLLRATDGRLQRALVSGRVLFHETLREALTRHLEKDLGSLCLPRVPLSPQPFTIGEYFPTPGQGFHDPRQHAVSLAYVVPVDGDCHPQQDTLEVGWFTPREALLPEVQAELVDGHGTLLRQALAHVGRLP
ncbi:NUDIX hydrolase family protein [Georgenia satyanarayanai]|uniref:NUDIX hydrolase family protein n=1 Tax=Georgenia satyanarayanai TaxID=860221 RepID=UPI0020414AED|nr:NUDIX hydrolase family protein [Georgenia satyanarayanai]MCM3660919.1 NUDIX hydrolase family protein [Georgenia satyanarayanai]